MSKGDKLDNLDRQILTILSKNARIPFKDVAEATGVSRAAVHQRVQKMIDEEVILGSMFNINAKSIGYLTCTYIGIQLGQGNRSQQVTEELLKIPEVVECHYTTGPYAMLIKLYARDNEHLLDLLHNRLLTIDGIISTETLISLNQSIMRSFPIDEPAAKKAKANSKKHESISLDDDAE